ncbi:ABC transporter substrate-binding protein [Rhodopseudomonas sp. HC1]|uniref:ABC transporter substrate-binding protein n=1 Tax=Rhodopseudomonas infernalis TaxID=2897386 RepID=UPI001EE94DC4|nr:ABC transporter substrate-binding protein [Rhodopseudomonas infernalis]MCG6203611.1 ABC transporter substrate-binding protein [Rhodopseudomonas infernalis]
MRSKRWKTLAATLALAFSAGSAWSQSAPVKIKIGVLNDQSGIGVALAGPGSVVAAQLAIADYEKAHPGSKIELISADHQNKPDVGSSIARQWYERDGVSAIFDVQTSSVALAVSELTRQQNKAFIASGAGSADLTGVKCSPNTVQWTYDTWALANATGSAIVKTGGKSWFFITADYSFGHALEKDTTSVVLKNGGTVKGHVLHPFGTADYASFILQAQASKSDIVGLATSSGDLINLIKQSAEFGVSNGGQKLAALLMFISDVHALGLNSTQGLLLASAFYWDLTPETRDWSKRFAEKYRAQMPTMVQAGVYASVLHYLKAVEALPEADRENGAKVIQKMKDIGTDDVLFGKGTIRADGRKLHDMYLFQVKTPQESKAPWDYYKKITTIPAAEAFRPIEQGGCPLVGQ